MASNQSIEALASKISTLCSPPTISISPSSLNPIDPEIFKRSLIFKVLTDLDIKFPSLRETLSAAWNPKANVDFKIYGDNVFLASFDAKEDADRVLRNGPWSYGRDFIVMQHGKTKHKK